MASEEVIELGSSDEETRPAKKIKAGPNAMVHIPNHFPGVTIKPTKSAAPGSTKGLKVVKINNVTPIINKNIVKTNGKTTQTAKQSVTIRKDLQKSVSVIRKMNKTLNVNPVTLIKKLNNSQIMINKIPSNVNVFKDPITIMKGPVNLPSSITVKKTSNVKRPAASNVSGLKKKQKINPTVREVLTIDSDEEETTKQQAAKPSAGPQWYLRPEEQEDIKNQEEKNNTEPDASKFIEITIEDSPVKPVKDKRTCKVGTELAITIEDSPVKSKEMSSSDSNKQKGETPYSKKRLEYPVETVEIEIPIEIEVSVPPSRDIQEPEKDPFSNQQQTETIIEHTYNKDKDEASTNQQSEILEVEESPAKKKNNEISEPKKAPSKVIDLDLEDDSTKRCSEFHPVYQHFIDMCLKIEDSVDMNTIVEKKIKSYYRQVPKDYTESEEFIDLVSGKLLSMKAGPEKIYLYIKDVVDELNMQRKLAKQQIKSEVKQKNTEAEKFLYGEETEFDSRRQRQIRKLEKTLKKLHRAIHKLEEQEVDFDDEEDSVYLLTERYKERMVRVHAKLCQLTNTKMPSEPRVQIDARPGQHSGPAKRLEKWVNKKVPLGTPLPFPDFHDVLRCVREANEEDRLGWNEADVMEEARDLFTRCGRKLQRRRQENEWRLAASRISADIDPAEENDYLKKKLEENRQLATKKETEVFNKYADRQCMLKLEAELVGDKEAEESPVESEEEEPFDDSCTMKNKERRKERLRRLIQEKPKSSEKNSSSQKEPVVNQMSDELNIGVIDDDNDDNVKNDVFNVEKETETTNTETKFQKERIGEDNKAEPKKTEKVHSISDSSDNVGSDIDELHLLQKLHSGNEVDSSTTESSDSTIDLSDTIQSENYNSRDQNYDVISIENSSYSDSDSSNDSKNKKLECDDANESSSTAKTTNTQADSVGKEPDVEPVLTVSDEDQHSKEDNESQGSDVVCMNTQDDAISIGDTEVQEIQKAKTTTSSVTYSNSKCNLPCIERCKDTSSPDPEKKTKEVMRHDIDESAAELKTPPKNTNKPTNVDTDLDLKNMGILNPDTRKNTSSTEQEKNTEDICSEVAQSSAVLKTPPRKTNELLKAPDTDLCVETLSPEQEKHIKEGLVHEIVESSAVLNEILQAPDTDLWGETRSPEQEKHIKEGLAHEIVESSAVLNELLKAPDTDLCGETLSPEQEKHIKEDLVHEIESSAVLKTSPRKTNELLKAPDTDLCVETLSPEQEKHVKEGMVHEIVESSAVLKTLPKKTNELMKTPDIGLTNKDIPTFTKTKVDDQQILIKEIDKDESKSQGNNEIDESSLSIKDVEIDVDKDGSQNGDLANAALCNKNESSINHDNPNTKANKGSSCPEEDKPIEKATESMTEVADKKGKILTLSNDNTNRLITGEDSKTENSELNVHAQSKLKDTDLDISENKNKTTDLNETDSLDHVLEQLRSEFDASEC